MTGGKEVLKNFFIKLAFVLSIVCVFGFFIDRVALAQVPRTVFVHLFEWKWTDIEDECEWLGKKGYGAVQISPPNEHRIFVEGEKVYPWWERYQPVSYSLAASRSGTKQELINMIETCNEHGVKIYVDAVINHMAGGSGTGTAGNEFDSGSLNYSGVPYSNLDFHDVCEIDYGNEERPGDVNSIRNCWLPGLPDLKTENFFPENGPNWVQQKIIDYMNELILLGVAGFRIDAAKHIHPFDINYIVEHLHNLRIDMHGPNQRPYIFQEVISGNTIKASDFTGYNHDVTEFEYARLMGVKFRDDSAGVLADFIDYKFPQADSGWNMIHSSDAVVFTDNHDNQRGHGNGYWKDQFTIGGIVTHYYNSSIYNLANVFMLAWPYGYPKVMSSYSWPINVQWVNDNGTWKWKDLNDWIGPPYEHDSGHNTKDVECFNGEWVCEHRWTSIAGMVGFRNYTNDVWEITNAWTNRWYNGAGNQIAFGRGDKGYVVINRENTYLDLNNHYIGMADGEYCDVARSNWDFDTRSCDGTTIIVSNGHANFSVPPMTASAIHVGSKINFNEE
jgi:hypothetical protein